MGKEKRSRGEKRSFVLYGSYADILKHLTREEKGLLLEAIFAHEAGEPLPALPRQVAIAFEPIRYHLELDREKYEEVARDNSRKAKLRWEREEARKKEGVESKKAENTKDAAADAPDIFLPKKDAAAFSALPTDAERCLNDDGDADEDGNGNEDADGDEDGRDGARLRPSRTARQDDAPSAPVSPARERDRFEEFWEKYPHKVYRDRARRAWVGFIGASEERAEATLAALSRAVREDHRFQSGHIPYPSNWLANDRPWEAGYSPPADLVRERSAPRGEERHGSFDTDEFFNLALQRSYRSEKGKLA